MKLFTQTNKTSKVLAMLTLSWLVSMPYQAGAEKMMPANRSDAPCGELHAQGDNWLGNELQHYSYSIYNPSKYHYTVHFITQSSPDGRGSYINAGVVKYLVGDGIMGHFWRDDPEDGGDYLATKTYTIWIKPKTKVALTYCASDSNGRKGITGFLSFSRDQYYPAPHTPDGEVSFEGFQTEPVKFSENKTSYVNYNFNPDGQQEPGSLTILDQP